MGIGSTITRVITLGTFISILGTASVFAGVQGIVTGSAVNARAENSAEASVIESLNKGSSVTILGKTGDWYQVSFDTIQSAYVNSQYIEVTNATAIVTADAVNVRSAASTDASVVSSLGKGDAVTVVGQAGDWYKISSTNGPSYIKKDFVDGEMVSLVSKADAGSSSASVSNTYAIVTSDTGLKLRAAASTSAEALTTLPFNEVVDVVEAGNEWLKVKTVDGATGYISAEFASVRTGQKPSRNNSPKGDQVIAYAKQFLGTPYVWSGTNLKSGVDCSGYVYAVFKNFGINLNRSSSGMASNGVAVSKSELIVGDLVLFDTTGPNDGGISHVGIYMGNGQYIHASSGKEYCVTISDLNNDYGKRTYVTARRVIR